MTAVDIDRLSVQERLDLIERLWDSLDAEDAPLTEAQAAEVDRRLATLDEDIRRGRSAETIIAELKQRIR